MGRSHEIVIVHGLKIGNDVGQFRNQIRGEILVQQDAHGLAVRGLEANSVETRRDV
jgi:hypothetical protein